MSSSEGKDPGNVARGLKASIHNDNVSEDAKQSAAQRLERMGEEVPSDFKHSGDGDEYSEDLNPDEVRGYKSTRGNFSREAKDRARQAIRANAGDDDEEYTPDDEGRTEKEGYIRASYIDEQDDYGANENDGSKNRVYGGYKATLKNPNVSDAAKQHAQEVLEDAGAI